jgi:hypothetical protein
LLANVAQSTVEMLLFGIFIAVVAWYFIKPERRALRLIDLASYSFTIFAFGSALSSVRHFEERWNASWELLDIRDMIADNGFENITAYNVICTKVPHSPYSRDQARGM